MADEFKIKDLKNLKYFRGIEVARSKESIFISQRKYTFDLLTEISTLGCQLENSDDKVSVDKEQYQLDKEQYQRPVGKLIYLSHT